jgi:hypothetical protein
MSVRGKYGSFKVTVNTENGEKELYVNPLSQNEISHGWRLVVPKVKTYLKEFTNKENKVNQIVKNNKVFFKVNFAQLPRHLYKNVRNVYKRGELSHYFVNERSYNFIIQKTSVDNEILQLVNFIEGLDANIYMTKKYIEEMRDLFLSVKEANIYGWVIFRCQNYFR